MAGMTTIAPGAQILVRDAVWRVMRSEASSHGQHTLHCVGLSELVQGDHAVFVREYEQKFGRPIEVLQPEDTILVADDSEQHRGALTYIESLLRDVPPRGDGVVLGDQAALEPLHFQLEPARLALGRPRARILIADAVGLGKTLEAGILLAELIRRGRARRILVVGLKSMLGQLQRELWTRFTIPLTRLDSLGLQRVRERIPGHHNPFHVFDRVILSIDTLKQHNAFRAHLEQSHWDVVVIDEAHNVARRGSGSQRQRLAELLATRCDHMILLSATPHDGRAESFASLMNLLDPTAIANPSDYGPHEIQGLYTRRTKAHVADELGERFPERTIQQIHATPSPEEEVAFEQLADLAFTRLDQRRGGSMLFKTTLEKSLFSSPAACRHSIQERIRRLQRRDDAHEFTDDITSLKALDAKLLAIGPGNFGKYRTLVDTLTGSGPDAWNGTQPTDRLVVFTERIQTLQWLHQHLPADLGLKDAQVAVLHGGMPDHEISRIVDAFGQEQNPLRLLLASDVAAEGLNLHHQCHRLVHFDVPWSLMTFQQRNGRVDRYGQRHQPRLMYLLTDTEVPRIRGDMRILEVLIQKDDQARRNLGDASAFFGLHNAAEEERATAEAIERGQSPEAFEAQHETSELDLVDMLLSQGTVTAPAPPRERLTTLFDTPADYLRTALDLLREDQRFEVATRKDILDIEMPDDLARRLRVELPDEAYPTTGRLVLTSSAQRLQDLLVAARGEASSWPEVHYLWPLHPVFDWIDDQVRHRFGRQRAPALSLPSVPAHHGVFVVAATLPNRRGQALLHRWYAVTAPPSGSPEVEPFEDWARQVRLGRSPLANLGLADHHLAALQQRLPSAVAAARQHCQTDRHALATHLHQRLAEERSRLGDLRARRLAAVAEQYEGRTGSAAERDRAAAERREHEVFERFDQWVQDAMTMERDPFLQVVAAFAGSRP